MALLTCPNCGTRLTVSPAAPRRLTCPRCLGKIENPASAGAAAPMPALPMRVIPIEEQFDRDRSLADLGMIVLVCFLAIGAMLALQVTAMIGPFTMVSANGWPAGTPWMIILGVPVAVAALGAVALWH